MKARIFCFGRSLAGGNKADFQCLRFDEHASDMAFDQLAVCKGGWRLRFTHCCKVPADAVAQAARPDDRLASGRFWNHTHRVVL
jgi:hypothetical protein